MNAALTTLAALALAPVLGPATASPSLPGSPLGTERTPRQEVTVDRWLVATVEAPDSLDAEARLARDLLASPGEPGVLPERGMEAAGATWRLLRLDGTSRIPLDTLDVIEAGVRPGTVAYAHSYIRLPEDRTLRLEWEGTDCTSARAWLNGRRLDARSAVVRFGAGWNTLLLKLVAGECPFQFSAALAAPVGSDASLEDVRVQASRPHGDVRTGPADWVVAPDTVRVSDELRWLGDRLQAGVVVDLTAWGRAPVADVELELREGLEGESAAPWLVPGRRTEVVVPIRLDRLRRALEDRRAEVRLRWGEEETDRRVYLAGDVPPFTGRLGLDGWEVVRSPAGEDRRGEDRRREGRLPDGADWVLEGEWRVPEALEDRRLLLDTSGAPAEYRLDGAALTPDEDGLAVLCASCSQGARLRLVATSTAPWTGRPVVRVAGGAGGS